MVKLNEGIAKIKKGSTLESLYNRLKVGMEASANEKLPDWTSSDYVTIGEDGQYSVDEAKINSEVKEYQSITRQNTAFLLADAVVSSIGDGGESGEGVKGAVKITGDSMTGKLNTLYGFSAGDNGVEILTVYQTVAENPDDRKSIVKIDGELHLGSNGLYINESNVLSYNNDVLALNAGNIALNADKVTCTGEIVIGDLSMSKDGIRFRGYDFYHSGNSNKEDVDWTMRNGVISQDLTVGGSSVFSGNVSALYGASLGYGGNEIFSISADKTATLAGDLNILSGGIKFDGDYIIHVKNKNVISFSASNKILNLGDDNTRAISLQSSIYDDDYEYELITKFGSAHFPESFKAGHGFGNTLIETYKNSDKNSGVIFGKYLKFTSDAGPGFYSDGDSLLFEAPYHYNTNVGDDVVENTIQKTTKIGYIDSTSLYAPLDRKSSSLKFTTDSDFYVFDKPIECDTSIGISGCKTRLLKNELFFNDGVYWISLQDGVKHYGNAYMVNDIGSVTFSSGFAGSGWKIYKNKLTGNICATFDELTIRKKMRVYELEVQKISATNGSLWVSDACSGDLVEEIT
jgi:hypothetical protein